MTPEKKQELRVKLFKMQEATTSFYLTAQRLEVHTFLEIAGFMQEQIKMYQGMVERGVDFLENDLQGEPHQLAYIAEKVDCIFGPALSKVDNRQAFLSSLADHGGWDPRSAVASRGL